MIAERQRGHQLEHEILVRVSCRNLRLSGLLYLVLLVWNQRADQRNEITLDLIWAKRRRNVFDGFHGLQERPNQKVVRRVCMCERVRVGRGKQRAVRFRRAGAVPQYAWREAT